MTRLTIFLFFFTLSTMAQQVQDTLGKVKTSQEVANTNSTLRCLIGGSPQPVFFLDGKIVGNAGNIDTIKSVDPEDVAALIYFTSKNAVNLFGKQAVGGAIYIVTEEAEKKIKEIQHKKLGKLTREGYKYYRIAQILEKFKFPIMITGRVTDDEGNPVADCKIENRERDTEVYTDSLGRYEIKARRWDAILSECVGQCRVVVTDNTEQTMNFVSAPLMRSSSVGIYVAMGLVGSPCDKLFVLNGKLMKNKKQFLKRIKNSKEIEAREIAEQEAMALYGTQGRFGIVAVRDEKGRKQDKIYTRKFKRKMRKTQQL